MARRGGGGVKQKKRKKVLVTSAVRIQDGKLTEPYRILEELIKEHRADLEEAEIVILWRSGWRADADGWTQMVNVKKAGDVDRALSVNADFAVMLNKELFPKLPERMKQIYLHHALEHMKPLIDSDGEQKQDDKGRKLWRVKKRHDVEQFSEIVKEYGEESLNLDKDAIAAIKDSERPLLKEEVASEAAKDDKKKDKEAVEKPDEWRNWPISVLGEFGLPKAKVKILEKTFDDRLGKLMDSLAKVETPSFWYRDIKGLGEGGYDAMTQAIAEMRKARPEFQACVW